MTNRPMGYGRQRLAVTGITGFVAPRRLLLIAASLLLASASTAQAQNKGKDDRAFVHFRAKAFITGDSAPGDLPDYLSADEIQELMEPSDDVQNWDALMASPIMRDTPIRTTTAPRDPLQAEPLLSELAFEDDDFANQLQSGYKNFNRGLAEGLFGKKAGKYFEIDIDKSPEIKFEIRFD